MTNSAQWGRVGENQSPRQDLSFEHQFPPQGFLLLQSSASGHQCLPPSSPKPDFQIGGEDRCESLNGIKPSHPSCPIKQNVASLQAHVFVGPLSPGAALIVKSCKTNFSANIFCITVENFTIPLWLWDYWKVVPCRPHSHSKKVNFKSNVTHLQEVIKNVYGKGLGL